MSLGNNDWVLVLGWAVNTTLGFAGIFERALIYITSRQIEQDPDLPITLHLEAAIRRQVAIRRVWLKLMMTLISVLELAVVWDRWWVLDYDYRDVIVCLLMTTFLIWMLTWRDP
jgi:hypothetical protein